MNTGTFIGLAATAIIALIGGMATLIKTMVAGRLDWIQETLKEMRETQNNHGEKLARHEAILELNGLTERRKYQRGNE